MARALRIEREGGRYHVTARGNERKQIYRDDPDREHFLELVGESTERFDVLIHAYVLMDNHYHLLMETRRRNLSQALQWLNVSYSMWFNRRHNRIGHLFQGRFKAMIVEDDPGWQEVGRYIHLNPVRILGLGLGKGQRALSRQGLVATPKAELVSERLRQLREYRWSSYRAYAGYSVGVGWLWRQPLDRFCGGKDRQERCAALRQYTEECVKQGVTERPWDRLIGGLVLGSATFARQLLPETRGNPREQPALRRLEARITWELIVRALEKVRGVRWEQLNDRHGDWGRDAALWLGRKRGGYRLGELGRLAGGLDYATVGQAISRFKKRLEKDGELNRQFIKLEHQLSNVEM